MNRVVFALVAILCLLSVSSITGFIQVVKASVGTIYIKADGSIDPPTAPISTIDNVTYIFTGNINDSVIVERDNIMIDGSGHTLFGIWVYSRGIDLTGRSNITINNMNILAFEYGIYLYSSSNVNISQNNLTDNSAAAIYVNSSSNNNANGNILTTNFIGIFLGSSSSNNSASENNIAGDTADYGSARFFYGIEIVSSSNNTLNENMITNNDDGIDLNSSSNNSIIGNNITENNYFGHGILLRNSTNNRIVGNNIANNYNGVTVEESSNNNSLIGNDIIASESWGVGLDSSSGNCLYHNNFINNTNQVVSGLSANVWDAGYSSGGNYWSDYNGPNNNQDGIGDTPYVISYSSDVDHYPLMGMFSDFNATSQYNVQTICNSTISDFQFNGTAISFKVSGENGTTGFCRICIPIALINGTFTVFVNGTKVPYSILPESNSTNSYMYFTYNHSTEQIIIVPEFPSFLILPLFMIATLLAVIVYRKKDMKTKGSSQAESRI